MTKKLGFFHLSNDFEKDIKTFIPRIPDSRMGKEDNTQNRVCVAPTIEDCIKAHPSILLYMNSWDICQRVRVEECMAHKHYLLEHGKSGFLCKLYYFEVEKEFVVTNEELQKNNLVPDADITNEHWITTNIQPVDTAYILVERANVEYCIDTGSILQEDIKFSIFESKEELGQEMIELLYDSHSEEIMKFLNVDSHWNSVFTKKQVKEFGDYLNEYYQLLDKKFRYTPSLETEISPF